ncbi:maltose O-acetyltransferas-like protein [Paraphoma chrysanthemicola]|uniref:Maltose O-acetyltransferas-like protein n=1 Tax=Paraphoma chrysanthemicola TaxID=798071 RepID=A0A8K0RGC3_9PLEO|nr:maltose O-acetyltransferas-like protein [Paraphoma chrysanthemicola]
MSTVLHLPLLNTQTPYMLKDKSVESFAPAFTAVNGRGSPPSSRGSATANGTSARQTPPQPFEQKHAENDYRSGASSSPGDVSSAASSVDSPNKRRRTDSPEENHTSATTMEAPQHRPLPPMDRLNDHERRWTAEPQAHNGYPEPREPRPMEPNHGSMPPMATSHPPMSDVNGFEPGNSAENRASIQQMDAKKRKRQFANRTKTGCGTCRRRKKKCDEAKPECNNCTRGGFVCEGYASKIPWPKNGPTKPPPPLQAKEQMHDPTSAYPRCPGCNQIHIPHCEPTRSNSQTYADARPLNGPEGARARPIVVEEQERKPPAPSSWNNGWNEPPRVSYPDHPPPPPVASQYPQPPLPHDRAPSHEHHLMSQPAPHPPAVADSHHQAPQQSRPPPMAPQPQTTAPPAPQSHYAPQSRPHKTEKEKMLSGEPFLPFDEQLMDERAQCTGAVYGFNSTANASVVIARGDRERNFKRIIAAGWIHPRHMDRRPGVHVGGHLGGNVNVTTPFHCDYGYNISIGDNVNIGPHCELLDSARIAIGRNTKVGARVTISTLKAPTNTKQLKGSNGTEIAREVFIGENVYIGDNVTIEAGVKIGNNAIIRSGSVVVSDIAPDVVARGNPAFG